MSKRLKTKYFDFINEDLYVKHDLRTTLGEMAKTNLIASLLMMMIDYPRMYETESQINFISFSDEINMLFYVPLNKRDNNSDMFGPEVTKVGMRIGRLIRRVIADVNKDSTKFTYTGKAIVSTERPIFNDSIKEDLTTLFFIANKTGDDFSSKWQSENFMMGFEDKESVESHPDLCGTDVKIKVGGMEYNTKMFQFDDNSYVSRWERDVIYFKMQFTDNLGIGYKESIRDKIKRGYKLKDDSNPIDIDMELNLTFGGKFIEQINDSDIEKFVNELIAYIKILRAPEGSMIEVVKGEDIRKWYDSENYFKIVGQLGGSCMAHKECQPYLDIYTENSENVSLLILKNGDKLVGRALLWKLNSGKYFMDRVYCTSEYDEKIFTKYAIDNGYYYRSNGNNNNIKYFFDGKEMSKPKDLVVTLHNCHFDYYPYMDTLKDLDEDGAMLHHEDPDIPIDKELRDTGGKWSGYESDEEESYEED